MTVKPLKLGCYRLVSALEIGALPHFQSTLAGKPRPRRHLLYVCMTHSKSALPKRRMVSLRLSERDYEQFRVHAGGNMSQFLRRAARLALVSDGKSERQ